jgi:hypothetical protein
MILKKALPFLLVISLFAVSGEISGQNLKADGYKGLWFKFGPLLEYGYKYSGGLGTFSSYHEPIAIYSAEARKTFFVYNGTTRADESHLQVMISYFDHRSHKVPRPVIVYDKMGVNDPQDNASLSIDSNGYIWVFISGRERTRPGLVFKSNQPYSIESFDKIMEGEFEFPQPWWLKDSCFILMHTKVKIGRDIYWSSSTDGKSWTASQELAGMGGHFQISNVYSKKLVTVFTYFPGGNLDKRTNLYLLQTDDIGKTWKTVDNKIIETPLTDIHNEAIIKDYESENKLVYINDLTFDSNGNPVILAIISRDFRPGPAGDPREWMIIHWKDNKWNFSKVCESGHNYDMGSLFIIDDEWRIIGSTEPGPQKYGTGGEMALWISKDEGASWVKAINITTNSVRNNSYARRPVNAQKNFYCYWVDGDADKHSISQLYFTNEKCNGVWVLPYEMKKDFEKPVRIK